MACWCVVQALKKHDKFRSVLSADGKSLKVFHHVNLGIAVALPGDEMVTAVIRDADQLDDWIEAAKTGLLESLANGIRTDRDAVHAALSEPWSNGWTEGQIAKLKLVKRQMYGRAKLDLIRARVVAAA